ncbi:hypothetical protein DFH07DRAFT_810324 [Mycena maculata]|uniref:Fungal-type protein kinase domain-containing protein n=1 Tax=Mycena maculata TaxID=230809 RepID=A0AAD7JI78_9AGAR|nr:hypothetical protein DFH07DRAFT_810324 [Mycena maculata]
MSSAIEPTSFYSHQYSNPLEGPSTPPPDASLSPVSLDTPAHQRTASVLPYSSINGPYQQKAFIVAADELKNKFTFTSAQEFLRRHLPEVEPTPARNNSAALRKIAAHKLEKLMYEPLANELRPFLGKGWSIVDTSDHPDPDSGFIQDQLVKPDISIYSDKKPSNANICRACDMECFLELKTDTADDPFADTETLEKDTARARDTRGQVITYLNAIQASQYRTHSFGVVIIRDKCRLLRLTRSGIEVTTSFSYIENSHLHDFLYRLSRAAPEIRGIDTTLKSISPASAPEASEILNAPTGPLWEIAVGERSFLVSRPFTGSHYLPVGRGTRCFVAVDKETNQKCLLKDTWRVLGYHAEEEVYERLHSHNVANIPGVLAAGDVSDHTCGSHPLAWHTPVETAIRTHQHYRIVLDVVGVPLEQFPSTYQLTRYMLDVLTAHHDAFTKAKVEHRDVSVGNMIVLIEEDGSSRALLIDWELARYLEDVGPSAYERTRFSVADFLLLVNQQGTRQFMSVNLLQESPPPRTLADDIESFLLVLTWVAVAYAPSAMKPDERAGTLNAFDDAVPVAKKNMLLAGGASVQQFRLDTEPFRKLLSRLMEGFKYRYLLEALDDTDLGEKQAVLGNHDWFMEVLRSSLDNEEWKTIADPGALQKVKDLGRPTLKRRKSRLSEYVGVGKKKARQAGERGPDEDEDEEV